MADKNRPSIEQFWKKKIVLPIVSILFVLFLSVLFYLVDQLNSKDKMVLDTIKKTVALSLTNPLQSSDELIIRNIITNIGRKYNLRIAVLSKNRDVIDRFSPNSFDFPELNLNEAIKISDSNQQAVGYLYMEKIGSSFSFGPMALVPMVIFILFIAFLMSSFKKVRLIYSDLSNISKDDYLMSDFTFDESYKHAKEMNKVLERNLENQKYRFLYEYARDLAHNLRQPLAVLNTFIRQLPHDFNQDMRELVVGVTKDVDDIINNLLDKYGITPKIEASNSKASILLISFLEKKITQARTAYNEKAEITLDYSDESYGLFAEVNPAEFGSVISNLINNSILAIDPEKKGDVKISLDVNKNQIQIIVSDNGPGFSEAVLEKLGKKGNTTRKNGHGLGIPHAIRTIEGFGGNVSFESKQENCGSVVTIRLPRVTPPAWFLERIVLQKDSQVIIVDDFQRIHKIWKDRFNGKVNDDLIKSFYSCSQFKTWHKKNEISNTQILVDYDFQAEEGEFKNGLDLIESLGISGSSILVTSHYEDYEIQMMCLKMGVKLLPKPMISVVPIEVIGNTSVCKSKAFDKHIIHIEDNRLIRKSWAIEAEENGLELVSFAHVSDFIKVRDFIRKDALFFIDISLGTENGIDLSKDIHEMGFKNIYFSTGQAKIDTDGLYWVKGVIGKDFRDAHFIIHNHQ